MSVPKKATKAVPAKALKGQPVAVTKGVPKKAEKAPPSAPKAAVPAKALPTSAKKLSVITGGKATELPRPVKIEVPRLSKEDGAVWAEVEARKAKMAELAVQYVALDDQNVVVLDEMLVKGVAYFHYGSKYIQIRRRKDTVFMVESDKPFERKKPEDAEK